MLLIEKPSYRKSIQVLNIFILFTLLTFVLKPNYFVRSNKNILKCAISVLIVVKIISKILLFLHMNKIHSKEQNLQNKVDEMHSTNNSHEKYKNEYSNLIKDLTQQVNNLKTTVNQAHNEFLHSLNASQKKLDLFQKNISTSQSQISDLLNRFNSLYKFAQDLQNIYNNNFLNLNNSITSDQKAILSLQNQLQSIIVFLNNIVNNLNKTFTNEIPNYSSTASSISFHNNSINLFNENPVTNTTNNDQSVSSTSKDSPAKSQVISLDSNLQITSELIALISNCQNLLDQLQNKFFIDIKDSLLKHQQTTFDFLQETSNVFDILSKISNKTVIVPDTINDSFIDDIQKFSYKDVSINIIEQSYIVLQRLIEKKILFNLNKSLSNSLSKNQAILFDKILKEIICKKDKDLINCKTQIVEKLKEFNTMQAQGLSAEQQKYFLSFFKEANNFLNSFN